MIRSTGNDLNAIAIEIMSAAAFELFFISNKYNDAIMKNRATLSNCPWKQTMISETGFNA